MRNLKFAVVGSGFFGAVVAERIASVLNEKVLVLEKRSAPGGNSRSLIDPESGIECHLYGSHIFHTANSEVWKYIRQFADFNTYQHKVLLNCGDRVFFLPINLKTLNEFYRTVLTPDKAGKLLQTEADKEKFLQPGNLEEKAISLIGRPLYEAFIAGYTAKQWGRSPASLPAEIITRLPIRLNYNTNYFSDPWQGIPVEGYEALFRRLLQHPNIDLKLNTEFREIKALLPTDCTVIYTGMIDELFDCCCGELDWRSLRFEWEHQKIADFQGTTVMNYASPEIPYTRIHEFKHYHPERKDIFLSERTVICREYPQVYRKGTEAYYPVNDAENQKKLAAYRQLAEKNPYLIPGGRLGCYQYWDMDKAIENALHCFEELKKRKVS